MRDKKITWEEFEEYYNNISASVDNDDYFELMMKNAWKIWYILNLIKLSVNIRLWKINIWYYFKAPVK